MNVTEHTIADAPVELLAMWLLAATNAADLDARLAVVGGAR
jgi:hypothetical protein